MSLCDCHIGYICDTHEARMEVSALEERVETLTAERTAERTAWRAEVERLRKAISNEVNILVMASTVAANDRGMALGAGEWVKCDCKRPYCQECRLRAALKETP